MKGFFRTLLIFLLSVGFIFSSNTARAAGGDCCLVISSQTEYGLNIVERIRNIGDDDEEESINSCHVASSCNTQPVRTCWSIRGTGIISERNAQRIYDDPECDDNSSRVSMISYERAVSCTSETLCVNALAALDNCSLLSEESCESAVQNNRCFYHEGTCFSRTDLGACRGLPRNLCGPGSDGISVEGSAVCRWLNNSEGGSCVQATEAAAAGRFAGTKSDILPDCAIQGTCRSLKDLEEVAFRIINVLFTIMGSVSFAFFIYGGIVMIASFGNSEQFGKGKSILVAAIVGIIISFSAYLLIGYLFDLLGIPGLFRGGINVGS